MFFRGWYELFPDEIFYQYGIKSHSGIADYKAIPSD